MNAILVELKRLQEVDDQLRQTRKTQAEAEARLTQAAEALKARESRLAAAQGGLKAMQSRHRDLEGELTDLSAKQKHNETRQMNVKSDQEYAALAKEAAFLSGRISELEDETLELLDGVEKQEAELVALTAAVAEESTAYRSLAEATALVQQSGQAQLTDLTARREAITGSLPALQLRQYDEIARVRHGLAVTAAAEGLCLACRLGFPPQIFNELQRNEKILTCPNCNRIIFWRDHPDFGEEASR
ncbi:MAG: C4-type zinc ribbon domain-containing protein [Candidatus Adiutrix sp.]|jgi:predicted  nucleic acid-binding Zn-ribbon protein|nr:C4-type zinc ribbon domain-containing protein [Candidatus Adiutrix sp.]